MSLMLVLLRKQLVEFDSATGDQRLVLTKQRIVELMKQYLPDATDEVKQIDETHKNIDRAESMGFLNRLSGSEDSYEVVRIIRSFIHAEHLDDINKMLSEYQSHINEK
jgi:hypothetical protein